MKMLTEKSVYLFSQFPQCSTLVSKSVGEPDYVMSMHCTSVHDMQCRHRMFSHYRESTSGLLGALFVWAKQMYSDVR